jgi:2',3'-cyclic-nucleotide 2'-phosphodiesterase/3'-nucleotidase
MFHGMARGLRLLAFPLACALLGAQPVTIRVLATTDLHGNLYPYDYFTAKAAPRGLAKIAALIAAERAANPNTLLIDCGDTIQGTPLEAVYQYFVEHNRMPLRLPLSGPPLGADPMILAMNALGYDSMTVGNHEFNYGLKNLSLARAAARFPWIAANIEVEPGAAVKPFAPYIVKTIAGVKFAVIGITTPGIPSWEKPANIAGCRFLPGTQAAAATVEQLRRTEHPDVILVAAHSGLDRNLKTGAVHQMDLPGENVAYQIASEVPGIDAIVFGHTHSELPQARVGNVLLLQPKNWGMSLGEMDLTLERGSGDRWSVKSKASRVIPVTGSTPPDEALLRIGRPYHEAAERYLNAPVAASPVEMRGTLGRVEDTPLVDMIHTAQLAYSHADVSFASMFNPRVAIPRGAVTVRQIAALYLYPNTLYTIEGDGKMVREALENSARYFRTCPGDCSTGPLIGRSMLGYNFDMAAGVDYEIDLRQPEGHRIRNLRWRGKPLEDGQKLRIALNNYRAGGSAGYTMFRGAKMVWQSQEEIRDLIIDYYTAKKILPEKADENWKIVPEAARRELERESRALAERGSLQ